MSNRRPGRTGNDLDEQASAETVDLNGAARVKKTVAKTATGVSRPVAASEPEKPQPDRRVSWLGESAIPAAVSLVLVLALLLVGFVNFRHSQRVHAGVEAEKVVKLHVVKLLSYTPATVLTDLDSEQRWLTGDFADEYQTLVKQTIAPAASKAEVTAAASITGTGVEKAARDRVVVLLFVNMKTSSNELDKPKVSGSRIKVTAVKVDGSWRISDLKPV